MDKLQEPVRTPYQQGVQQEHTALFQLEDGFDTIPQSFDELANLGLPDALEQ